MSWFIFALAAAILLSATSVIEKKVLYREHAMEFSAVLALFNAVVSLPLLFIADMSRIEPLQIAVIYLASLIGTGSFLLMIKATRHLEISISSPMFLLGPGVVAIAGYLFLGESLTGWQIMGIILLVLGSYALQIQPGGGLWSPLRTFYYSRYLHLVFFALLLYAAGSLADRVILTRYTVAPVQYIPIIHIFIALNFFLLLYIFYDGAAGIRRGITKFGPVILLLAVMTTAHRFFYAQAAAIAFIGLVSAVKRVSSLFTTLIGGELFHDQNLGRKFLAALVMLGGVFLIAF